MYLHSKVILYRFDNSPSIVTKVQNKYKHQKKIEEKTHGFATDE
jgi:hypothetical protein